MSRQESFDEHGTEFMSGDKVRRTDNVFDNTVYTVTHYTRNDAYEVREPVHNTTVEYYVYQLEKVGKKKHEKKLVW